MARSLTAPDLEGIITLLPGQRPLQALEGAAQGMWLVEAPAHGLRLLARVSARRVVVCFGVDHD